MNARDRTRRLLPTVRQDGLLRWLARLVSTRKASLALIAAILTGDFTIPCRPTANTPGPGIAGWLHARCYCVLRIVIDSAGSVTP